MRRVMLVLLTVAIAALLCGGEAYAQGAGSSSKSSSPTPPAPHLVFVFEEYVTLGASIHPGATPRGDRNIVPITGGVFSGPKIRGKVLPGGWDWQLSTKTGCFSLHADYFLKADDGAIINVVNPGTICAKPGAHAKIFTTPTFEAPLGPDAWLNGGAYIGTLEVATGGGKPAVRIRYYQVK